jgi:TonB-dependent starch-binding outer membrane protein SusC
MNLSRLLKKKVSFNSLLMRILLVCVVQGVYINIFAQDKNEPKITLSLNQVKLTEVFTEIEKALGYSFRYANEVSKDTRTFTFSFSNTPISSALKQIASKAGLSYKIDGKDVSVKQLEKKKVNGKITDAASGEPLIGVTVSIEGTTEGTITDAAGSYNIMAYSSSVLKFSYIGYESISTLVGDQQAINISLKTESTGLNEVVVVGYASIQKANLTGSVARVSGEDINKRPIAQGTQALQGLAPGIYVNTNSGEPGNDDASIIIRGIGTLNEAEPLVLIDGIEAPLANLNTNDIESINVLKDAASASIYGTRAANGVILITTKRGKEGKPVINYNGSYSITAPTVLPKYVFNTKTYLETYNKAQEYAGRTTPFTPELIGELSAMPNTNWVDEFITTGAIQNHDLSVSAGNENIKYRFSTRYFDQDGFVKGDWYTKRLNTRLNVDMKLSDKINMGASMAFTNNKNRQASKNDPGEGESSSTGKIDPYAAKGNFLYTILLVAPPNMPVYDEFGRYGGTGSESTKSQRDNPQGLIDNQWISADGNEFLGNVFVEYEPVKNLKFKYTSGINAQQESYEAVRLQYEQYDRFGNRSAVRVPGSSLITVESSILNYTNWLQSTYVKSFGNHNLNLLAGINQETSTIGRTGTSEKGFGSTSLVRVGNGTESVDIFNRNGEWALQSLFGRVNYNYLNKYLLELNIRRDGSSRFGANNRWATFPGVSAGYVLSEEGFWNIDFISHLKFRASWGKLGVQSANLYPFASELLLGRDYNDYSGAALTKLGNQELEWEETTTKDMGMDIRLFDGRIYLEGDYFIKTSNGILTDLENPLTTGIISEISVNSAQIENKGWELTLNTKNRIRDIQISTGFNLSHVKNKVIQINPALTNQDDKVQVRRGENVWWIRGEPVNSMYGHQFGGIFQTEDFNADGSLVSGVDYSWIGTPRPGDIKYVDHKKDNIINEEDMVVIGNRNPEWIYGFNLDMKYKGFDLGMFFQGVGKVNGYINRYTGNYGHSGLREFWMDGWTEENRSNTVPRIFVDRDGFNGKSIEGNGGLAQNAFWVTDLSYFRLKNIVLGYTFSNKILNKLHVSGLRTYVSGQNIWTLSKLDDLDPERNPYANHFGGILPQAKAVTFGMNLTF